MYCVTAILSNISFNPEQSRTILLTRIFCLTFLSHYYQYQDQDAFFYSSSSLENMRGAPLRNCSQEAKSDGSSPQNLINAHKKILWEFPLGSAPMEPNLREASLPFSSKSHLNGLKCMVNKNWPS